MNKVDTVAVIRSLLSSTNSSYGVYNLNKDFKNETGVDIPLFGYSSITDFLNSIPDTVKITGTHPTQQISLVANQKSSHIVSLVKRQKTSGQKNNFFKTKTLRRKAAMNVRSRNEISNNQNETEWLRRNEVKPIQKAPRVLRLAGRNYMSSLPKAVIKKEEDPFLIASQEFGMSRGYFNSTIRVGGECQLRTEEIQGSRTILDKRHVGDFIKSNDNFKEKAPSLRYSQILPKESGFILSLKYLKGLPLLKDSWCIQESIPSINLELYARVGEYVEVCPCQIFSPHKFYFQFRVFQKKFGDFFEKFQVFYSTKEVPKMKCEIARPTQLCAVFHKINAEQRWHRAEINEILSNSRALVNFIDCGKTDEIPIENIKFLHKDFISLPRQAVLGCLANIRPSKSESKWSFRATKKFHDLAFRKALVAGVVEINSKTSCLAMALSSTKGPEIHINDTLVKEGYAEFDTHVLKVHFTGNLKRTNICASTQAFVSLKSLDNDHVNYYESFSRNNSKSLESSNSSIDPAPVYFQDYSNNNSRLKKMFSSDKE